MFKTENDKNDKYLIIILSILVLRTVYIGNMFLSSAILLLTIMLLFEKSYRLHRNRKHQSSLVITLHT